MNAYFDIKTDGLTIMLPIDGSGTVIIAIVDGPVIAIEGKIFCEKIDTLFSSLLEEASDEQWSTVEVTDEKGAKIRTRVLGRVDVETIRKGLLFMVS